MKLTYKPFNDYVLIDLETTGLSATWDDIIEICCLKIHDGIVSDELSTLIKPKYAIPDYITEITGITNDMVQNKPDIYSIRTDVLNFIKGFPVVGHNVTFDVNFLKRYIDYDFDNVPYTDTMFLARRILSSLKHHRLSDLAEYFELDYRDAHRSKKDCLITKDVYDRLVMLIPPEGIFSKRERKIDYHKYDLRNIAPDSSLVDIDNLFYGKYCVFTGSLDKMHRTDAAQLVANIGGFPENGVTKKTNFLILGSNDYCKSIKDGKSNKQKKAEKLKMAGQDIEIITEDEFYSAFDIEKELVKS